MDWDKAYENEIKQYLKEDANSVNKFYRTFVKKVAGGDIVQLVNDLINKDQNINKQYDNLQKQLKGKPAKTQEKMLEKWVDSIIVEIVLSDHIDELYHYMFDPREKKRAVMQLRMEL